MRAAGAEHTRAVVSSDRQRTWDCLIIGGGPAGLTAATYLSRYRRGVLVIDAGDSRAAAIPASHNHPGFGSGISGVALLKLLREQAQGYAVELRNGRVEALSRDDVGFIARSRHGDIHAHRILLATGITDVAPDLPGLDHAVAGAL